MSWTHEFNIMIQLLSWVHMSLAISNPIGGSRVWGQAAYGILKKIVRFISLQQIYSNIE